MSDFSLRAALCFDSEQGGLRCTRLRCYDARRRRVGRCMWRGGSRPSLAPMTKGKGRSPLTLEAPTLWKRSRCDEHGGPLSARDIGSARPTGIVMVAPPEVPRNAGAKRRPRCSTTVEVERNQRQYKGRSPKASAQNVVNPP
jgi:hypothetical protein